MGKVPHTGPQGAAWDRIVTNQLLGKSTGLGLSMTFGYVRQSSGYLRMESRLGEGATITILTAHRGGSMKRQILIAEDEVMLRVIAVEMLEDAGFEVFQAGDGEEALTLLKLNPGIALLVSDIKMPRMDGYALVKAGLDFKPDLKILMMTGYAQDPPPDLIRERQIEILRKPFNLDRLCQMADSMTSA
jgi:CheY-like chemotaxis protein